MTNGERPDRFEYDPRWEVQPEPQDGTDPSPRRRPALVTFLAMAIAVALFGWLILNSTPTY